MWLLADVLSTWTEGSIIVAAMRKDGRVGVEVHRHLTAQVDRPLDSGRFH